MANNSLGLPNLTNTVRSYLQNQNTAQRIYTLQDRNGTLADLPTPLGERFTDNFARASLGSAYTQTGASASFTCDGSKLNVVGGLATLTEFITRNNYVTDSETWTAKLTFTVKVVNGTAFGIGFNIRSFSTGTNRHEFIVNFDCTNSANQGKIRLYTGSVPASTTPVFTSQNGQNVQVNDIVDLTVSCIGFTYHAIAFNRRTKAITMASFTFSNTVGAAQLVPNHVKFGIMTNGGTYEVTSFSLTQDVPVNPDVVFLCDSIFSGYFATTVDYRAASVLASIDRTKRIVVYGRQGLVSGDIAEDIVELAAIRPKYAFLNIGYNDNSQGIPAGTVIANLTTIKNALEAVGTTVIFISIIGGAYNTNIISSFGSTNQYIDITTLMTGVAAYFADAATHPNRAGNYIIARTIYESCRNIFQSAYPSNLYDGV